jgi:hypothetical protein
MSRGRSEAHPPPKFKHDRRSNGRIILFMLASFASSAVGCHDESGPSFTDWQSKTILGQSCEARKAILGST